MPVLECSCGMVMSISIATPRNTCIRCGGVEFRELERFKPVVRTMDFPSLVSNTTCGNDHLISQLATAGKAVSPFVVSCSL
jgi:hypothetical protein